MLDEAFAGVDDRARAKCLGLLAAFDLDVVMTSEREWGCYAEVPGLAIAQLSRIDGVAAVLVTRWEWDGAARTRVERATESPDGAAAATRRAAAVGRVDRRAAERGCSATPSSRGCSTASGGGSSAGSRCMARSSGAPPRPRSATPSRGCSAARRARPAASASRWTSSTRCCAAPESTPAGSPRPS